MTATSPGSRWRRSAVALLALSLIASACGDDDDASPAPETTSTTAESTTTTEATTTTTEEVRRLTEEQLLSVLLRPEDVPDHLVPDDRPTPSGWQTTDPPACGETFSGDGPGEVRTSATFVEPDGFLSFESIADHTPGETEDVEQFREAVAGPCAAGASHVTDEGIEAFMRTTPIDAPDVGDDALAARWDITYELQGHAVETWGYMVYFRRGDVSLQVQVMTGAAPSAGLTGADVSFEEVEQLARQMDERLAAL